MTPNSASYLPGTPGGQPMTPGTGGLDAMSPVIGVVKSFPSLLVYIFFFFYSLMIDTFRFCCYEPFSLEFFFSILIVSIL